MRVHFTANGWNDYQHWVQADADLLTKVSDLIEECRRTPFTGRGKPEALKGTLAGFWSRRITRGHRLVYRVEGKDASQRIEVIACRYHYGA